MELPSDYWSGLLPLAALRANRHLSLALTQKGGHIGWSSGWADQLAASFLLLHTRPGGVEGARDGARPPEGRGFDGVALPSRL